MVTYIKSIVLSMLLLVSTAYASVPPHPKIAKKIKEGNIRNPYPMEHYKELFKRGVNAPWRAALAKKGIRVPPNAMITKSKTQDVSIRSTQFKALLIVVDFSDHTSSVSPNFFDGLIFGTASNTLRDYYQVVSYGELDVVTVNLPSTMGWMRMGQPYSYYVNGNYGFNDYPTNVQKLAEDAVHSVDAAVDFSNYDNDGDGYVEALMIVHTGAGAEFTGSSNDIWSHSWEMNSPQFLDGVYTYAYTMMPEYWETAGDMTCGVYAHEFAHMVFDLPDLYDYDGSSMGLGLWSLMAAGSWSGPNYLGGSPAFPDAWSRMKMGFTNNVNVTSNVTQQQIESAQTSPTVYRLWKDGAMGNEYFLVENRQKSGYDTYLPGSGLCIYHIDENIENNDKEWVPGRNPVNHYLVALEQADEYWDLEGRRNLGDSGDPYPGSNNIRYFSFSSWPDSKDYSGNDTYVGVLNISNSSVTMAADLKVTGCELSLAPAIYVEPGAGSDYYKFNGSNVGTTYNCPLTYGVDFTIESISTNPEYVFSYWKSGLWSDISIENPRTMSPASYIRSTAVHKLHLGSSIEAPTTSFGQRQLASNADGTEFDFVYESAGEIWYTCYSGGTWSNEIQLSARGHNSSPSIARDGDNVYVVWQEFIPAEPVRGYYDDMYAVRVTRKASGVWSGVYAAGANEFITYSEPPTPVVSVIFRAEYGGKILVVFNRSYDMNLDFLPSWTYPPFDLLDVWTAYSNEPITEFGIAQANPNTTVCTYCYTVQGSSMKYWAIDKISSVAPASDNVPLASSYGAYNGTTSLRSPQILNYDGRSLCCWIEVQSYATRNVAFVCYQEKKSDGTWDAAKVFDMYESAGNENPDDVQSLTMSRMVNETILMWTIGNNIYQARVSSSGQELSNTGMIGYNPQLSVYGGGVGANALNSIYCTNNTIPSHMTLASVINSNPLTTQIPVSTGWNFVSVPREVPNLNADAIFPGKYGAMFSFNTSTQGYNIEENLTYGEGYWIFYTSPNIISITGPATGPLQIEVTKTGWALIGSRATPVDLSSLVLSNGSMIVGDIGYWYNSTTSSYDIVTQLTPGQACWVFVSGATTWPCTITIPAP